MNNANLSQLLTFIWNFFGQIEPLAIKYMTFDYKKYILLFKLRRNVVSVGTLGLNRGLGPFRAKFGPNLGQI